MKRPTTRHWIFASFGLVAIALATFGYVRRWAAPEPVLVRVLCRAEWIDGAALERFARAHAARVEFYTYDGPAEMLRQLANADGRVDVVCSSSLLLRSLVRSGWIKRFEYDDLASSRHLAADFRHLPYDANFEYGFPVHWQAFGWLSAHAVEGTLKQFAARGRVGVWATPLNYMALLTESGVRFDERLDQEDPQKLGDEVHRFVNHLTPIRADLAKAEPAAWAKRFDVAHVPALAVPAGAGFFSPGEDGGIVDVGLLAVGERAAHPELALELIASLSEPPVALATAMRTGLGTTFAAGEGEARLKPSQRPSALRALPLTKLRFPDVSAEALLKFGKIFSGASAR